jgi:hypothetical protein
LGLELSVDHWPNIEKSGMGSSPGDGNAGEESGASLLAGFLGEHGEAQSKQNQGLKFVHILIV